LQADQARRSTLSNFTFENIKLLRAWKVEGEVRGNADAGRFEKIRFNNVELAGKLMRTRADGGLNLINTSGVTIEGHEPGPGRSGEKAAR